MFTTRTYPMRSLLPLLIGVALASTATAAPPDHAGGPHNQSNGPWQSDHGHSNHGGKPGNGKHGGPGFPGNGKAGIDDDVFFDSKRREIIRDYYDDVFRDGFCPPGLAKKHNGCMPPGQAKKWRIGYALPDDVIYHRLPRELAVRLGYANPAYELIRVGADILRLSAGTGIVVEALEGFGGLY